MFCSPHQPVKDLRAEAPATRLDLTCELWLATRLDSFLHLEPPLGQLAVVRQFHRSAAPECIAHLTESGLITCNYLACILDDTHSTDYNGGGSSSSTNAERRNSMHCPRRSLSGLISQRDVNIEKVSAKSRTRMTGSTSENWSRCCPHGQLGRSRLGEGMY